MTYIKNIVLAISLVSAFGAVQAMKLSAKKRRLNAQLLAAACEDDAKKINVLIKDGADVNTQSRFGTAPLHWAVGNGYTKSLQELLSAGADVNAKDNDGWTPLHWAAKYGYIESLQRLLAAGADTTIQVTDGWAKGKTPYEIAKNYEAKQIIVNHVTATRPEEVQGIMLLLLELKKRNQLPKDIRKLLASYLVCDIVNTKLDTAVKSVWGWPDELWRQIKENAVQVLSKKI